MLRRPLDAQVTWDRLCTPSCWHGMTSVVVGNCGFALGRAAFWSDACSSGTNEVNNCTFALTGNASVTGSVQ